MSEAKAKKWWQRPGILAVSIIGALLLTAVPYAQSVRREYNRFAEYSKATLHDAETPPWGTEPSTPENCAAVSLKWLAECPGIDDFCIDGSREVVRRCLQSQDHKAWCEAQRENWATTNFGFAWCKAGEEAAAPDERIVEAYDDGCDIVWRTIANHCERLVPLFPAQNSGG